jgi:hypothetical protein
MVVLLLVVALLLGAYFVLRAMSDGKRVARVAELDRTVLRAVQEARFAEASAAADSHVDAVAAAWGPAAPALVESARRRGRASTAWRSSSSPSEAEGLHAEAARLGRG